MIKTFKNMYAYGPKILILSVVCAVSFLSSAAADEDGIMIYAQMEQQNILNRPENNSYNNADAVMQGGQQASDADGGRPLPNAPDNARQFGIDPTTGERTYYDAGKVEPESEFSDGLLRKADPKSDPGRKVVIVKEEAGPTDQKSLTALAIQAMRENRYEAALAYYNRLSQRNPNDKVISLGKAIALQKLGRSDAARQAYEHVLQIDPENVTAKINLAGILSLDNPSVSLQRTLELYNQNPEKSEIAAQLGIAYAELGRYEDAARYLNIARSIDPTNASYYFNMAIVAERVKDHEKAVQYYEKALELDAIYGGGTAIYRDTIYDRLAKIRNR